MGLTQEIQSVEHALVLQPHMEMHSNAQHVLDPAHSTALIFDLRPGNGSHLTLSCHAGPPGEVGED